MSREVPIPDDPMSPEEAAAFARLSKEEVKEIDNAILSCAASRWLKVARVVVEAEGKLRAKYPQFSYNFYADRVAFLAESDCLDWQGDLSCIRFSEVRLPDEN